VLMLAAFVQKLALDTLYTMDYRAGSATLEDRLMIFGPALKLRTTHPELAVHVVNTIDQSVMSDSY